MTNPVSNLHPSNKQEREKVMKTVVQKPVFLTVVLMVLFLLNTVNAQNGSKTVPGANAVKSLIAGINSENYGLKRNCIYFAGLYRIKEASDALEKVLLDKSVPENQILAALSVYRIDNDEVLARLRDYARVQENTEVKRMYLAVYKQHQDDSGIRLAGAGK